VKTFLELKKKASEMQAVTLFKTTKQDNPPICPDPPTISVSIEPQ